MKYEKINLILLFILLMGFTCSCHEEYQSVATDNATGWLSLGVSIKAEVSDISTRGTVTAPSLQDFTITITNTVTSEVTSLTASQTEVVLEVGSYTIEAAYGENVCSTSPYYHGEEDFVIEQGKTTTVNLTSALASAVIHPSVAEDLLSHFSFYQLTVAVGTANYTVDNNTDFFVPANTDYVLTLAGINVLGESKTNSWNLNSVVSKTRYTINCNPDLPSFTLPEQAAGNAWSKFIYITPMTASNIASGIAETDKFLTNIVYEASADRVNWIPAVFENGKWIIKDLQPSNTYTIRSRFGGVVSSNTKDLITESAQQLSNGDMEGWSKNEIYGGSGAISAPTYSDQCTGWSTRNDKTTSGAEGANGNIITSKANYAVYWKWCSGTVPTSDCSAGSKAAEISTLGLYNSRVSGAWSRKNLLGDVSKDGTVYIGYLFTGTFNKNTDTCKLGVLHEARPNSFSFDYKYMPIALDECVVTAAVYDVNGNQIASIDEFRSTATSGYITKTLDFSYTDKVSKASKIYLFFKSGYLLGFQNMKLVEGSYDATPYKYDRVVGSVLKIDNVTLNYE